jgi:hypothetical protein
LCSENQWLENQDFVRRHCPIPYDLQITHLHTFDEIFKPEPAGFTAGLSGGDFAMLNDGFEHTLDVVIAIRGLLSLAGAGNPIGGEKHTDAHSLAFDQVHCQSQGIVWTLISVWRVVDDKKNGLFSHYLDLL